MLFQLLEQHSQTKISLVRNYAEKYSSVIKIPVEPSYLATSFYYSQFILG